MLTAKAQLDFLFYEIAKQSYDFQVAIAYKDKDDLQKWSKWLPYSKAQENQKFMEKVNNRQLLDCEVLIDLDLLDGETPSDIKNRFNKTIQDLNNFGLKFKGYFSGSKGYHIHLFFQKLRNFSRKDREQFREYFILLFSGDLQKKTDKCMIALENALHWKTGKQKELISDNDGDNDTQKWVEKIQNKLDDDIKTKQNSSFILDEQNLPQNVNHAVGFLLVDNEKFRYYGVKLNQEISKVKKGCPIKQIQKVSALVLENGRIISQFSKPENLNFVFESEMSLKNNRWSLQSINQFILGKSPKISLKFVFLKFKESYDSAMVFESPEMYELNALWDLCTYFSDVLDKYPIIKHEGLSGTAKSKGMKISANQSFNGKKFLCPTPANFFRYRHNNKATLYIEEAERLFDDSKKRSSGDSELVEYLNGSYEKGNTVPRQDKDDISVTLEFDPSGFSRIGSIKPLQGALQSRSIPLHMIKAPQNDKRGNVEIGAENDIQFQQKRDFAYISALQNYAQFMLSLKNVKNHYNLHNRQWMMSKSLLALAHVIDSNLESRIGGFIFQLYNIQDRVFDEKSWETVLAGLLIDFSCQKKDPFFVSNENLNTIFLEQLRNISDQQYNISVNKVSRMMSDLGFSNFRCTSSDGSRRGYGNLDFFKISGILIRNDILNIQNILKIVSNASNCQIADEKIHKWHFDTFGIEISQCVNASNFSDTLTDTTLYFDPLEEKNKENLSKTHVYVNTKDEIMHKCVKCGHTPCSIFNDKGQPICKVCLAVDDIK